MTNVHDKELQVSEHLARELAREQAAYPMMSATHVSMAKLFSNVESGKQYLQCVTDYISNLQGLSPEGGAYNGIEISFKRSLLSTGDIGARVTVASVPKFDQGLRSVIDGLAKVVAYSNPAKAPVSASK